MNKIIRKHMNWNKERRMNNIIKKHKNWNKERRMNNIIKKRKNWNKEELAQLLRNIRTETKKKNEQGNKETQELKQR